MSDQYPSTLSIEIDRDRLRNYLRLKWLFSWALPFCFVGGMFGLASVGTAIEHGFPSRAAAVLFVASGIATGIGYSFLFSLFCYLILSHRLASRLAGSLEVSVEGSFLHVRQHTMVLSDRKLHFRSIVDYAATQDFLMRCFSIYDLQMTTTAGGPVSTLILHGVKDCLRIRDVLAEIDRQRENQ